MNELANSLGLEYQIKIYINRSDLYTNEVINLEWFPNYWYYTYDEPPMVAIYLRPYITYGLNF
jgi:hypothetical protein